MNSPAPELSVVVPTCNRVASLERLLTALARQDCPPQRYEVVVVADGDHKAGTFLQQYRGPLSLRSTVQDRAGPGPARNTGAALARGPVLLFLDDDIEPLPGLLQAHLAAAREGETVCVGNLTTVIPEPHGFLENGTREWWEYKFRDLRDPGHRFDYTALLSGHVSLPKALFGEIGGFNPQFQCREDYEFGARLIKRGARFRFLADAAARHHERPDLAKVLKRGQAEGVGDVRLARSHPELIPSLLLTRYCRARSVQDGWTESAPGVMQRWAGLMERSLELLQRWELRQAWGRCFICLKRYWYVRGMVAEAGSWTALEHLVETPRAMPAEALTIDLAGGFEKAEAELDARRPASVRVMFSRSTVGVISARPVAEPVQGRHLRPYLRTGAGFETLVGMAWQSTAAAG